MSDFYFPPLKLITLPREQENSHISNWFSVNKQYNTWSALDFKNGRGRSFSFTFPHIEHLTKSEESQKAAKSQMLIWREEYVKKMEEKQIKCAGVEEQMEEKQIKCAGVEEQMEEENKKNMGGGLKTLKQWGDRFAKMPTSFPVRLPRGSSDREKKRSKSVGGWDERKKTN